MVARYLHRGDVALKAEVDAHKDEIFPPSVEKGDGSVKSIPF
jgi:hypothetical protein